MAVLNLGNISFSEKNDDVTTTNESKQFLQDCCKLLGVDIATLVKALTKRSTKV